MLTAAILTILEINTDNETKANKSALVKVYTALVASS